VATLSDFDDLFAGVSVWEAVPARARANLSVCQQTHTHPSRTEWEADGITPSRKKTMGAFFRLRRGDKNSSS
jgi:hypothetical protein